MNKIKINGEEYVIKYTIRALFMWEQITGKPFKINTLLDNYIFFYCMLLANNKDKVLEWDSYLDALDNDTTLFSQMTEIVNKAEEEKKISLRVMLRKKKNPPCRQPQGRERQTGSATGYYPTKGSRQAALRLSIFLKSGLPFENIPSLPPCNKQGLSTRIFSYNTPPLLGLLFCK